MLALHGFLPGHWLPTRDDSCLDHMILKLDKSKNSAFVAVLNTTVTDHAMVLLGITHTYQTKSYDKSKTVTNIKNAYEDLVNTDTSFLKAYSDPDMLV